MTPERRQIWWAMYVFGSERSIEAWKAYLTARQDVSASIGELRVALSEQSRAPQFVTLAVGTVAWVLREAPSDDD